MKNILIPLIKSISKTAAATLFFAVITSVFFKDVIFRTHWLREDFFIQNFPNRFFATFELYNLSLPLWNPFVFSGMPFLADIQTGLLYPLNLILPLFSDKGALSYSSFEYQVILHFVLSGLFMTLFLRSLDFNFTASLLGGTVFSFNGFLINHAHHSNMIHSAVWLPLVLYFCHMGYKKNKYMFFGASLALTISLFGGHPQITMFQLYMFTLFYFFLYYLYRWKYNFFKIVLIYLFTIIVFLLLSMIQILPTLEFLTHTVRKSLDLNKAALDSLPRMSLLTLFMPDLFMETYGIWQRWEFRFYAGTGTLIVAAYGLFLKYDSRKIFFLLIASFSLILALGNNSVVYPIFFKIIPGFTLFRVPARFTYVFTFTAAVLAGVGFHALTKGEYKKSWTEVLVISLPVLFFSFIPLAILFVKDQNPQLYLPEISKYTALSLVNIILCMIMIRYGKRAGGVGILLFIILLCDLYYYKGSYNLKKFDSHDISKTIYYSPLAWVLRDAPEGVRFSAGRKYSEYVNMGLVYRKSNIGGYNPFMLKRYSPLNRDSQKTADFLGALFVENKKPVNPGERGFRINVSALPRVYFVNRAKIDPSFDIKHHLNNGTFDPLKLVYLEKEISGFNDDDPSVPAPKYTITNYENRGDEIYVSMTNDTPGFLIFSEIFYPGWKAYVNGERTEVLCANSLLRAVKTDMGRPYNDIVLKFEPASFKAGRIISVITFFALLVFAIGKFVFRYNTGKSNSMLY